MFTQPLLPLTHKEAFSLALFTYMSPMINVINTENLGKEMQICVPSVLLHYMSLSTMLMVTLVTGNRKCRFLHKVSNIFCSILTK
jgi:hypothetical protein